jgi:amidase
METYVDWMRSCYFISMTALPAISVPAGFTPEGLPVGLQIVGRHQDDWSVLQMAHAFETASAIGAWPPVVREPYFRASSAERPSSQALPNA